MFENDLICVLYFIEMCSFIIPDVSDNVQTREINKFLQSHGVFHEVAHHDN